MEDSPVVPGSPYFIMTYDTAKKLTGITEQTGILAIKNSEGCFDEVLTAVQKIADKNEKIEVNTIEQTIKNIQHRYSASINALYHRDSDCIQPAFSDPRRGFRHSR